VNIPHHSAERMAARRRIRRAAARVARACGLTARHPTGPGSRLARILVYHSVSDDPRNPFAVSPAAFRAQMEHVASNCRAVALPELAAAVAGGREIPERCVAVTFDDGYEDNYLNAYPVLRECSIPATIFLVAGMIRTAGSGANASGPGEITFMTWEQVREMAAGGVTFGSHTMTHPSLAALGPGEAAREMAGSKALIERNLGIPVSGLAYPYGTRRDVDAGVIAAARESGYTHACMAINGTVRPGSDTFALPRTKIEFDDDMEMFRGALEGSLDIFMILDRARGLLGARQDDGLGKKEGNR
jgi:peptidoglycan/xylan/chitin deacetylase (PgdA/CDA1 family)